MEKFNKMKKALNLLRYLPYLKSRPEIRRFLIFDQDFYLLKYPDIKLNKLNPFIHYIHYGHKEERQPNPLFDPFYYKRQIKRNISGDPFLDYLKRGYKYANPHPLFDQTYYFSQFKKENSYKTPLEYYIKYNRRHRKSPTPLFDWEFYKNSNTDISENQIDLLIHYLKYGEFENRNPNYSLSSSKLRKRRRKDNENQMTYSGKTKLELISADDNLSESILHFQKNLSGSIQKEKLILFVSHEASRTGAPLIILEIAKNFSKIKNIRPFFILLSGGDLLSSFQSIGFTFVLNGLSNYDIENKTRAILSAITNQELLCAYVNSAESRYVLKPLFDNKIFTISLIHEMANLYNKNEWNIISLFSDKIVFPSQIVKELGILNNKLETQKIEVRGQGLLKPELFEINKNIAKVKLRKELGIPEESLIILGSGTRILRKGIDLFVNIAFTFLTNNDNPHVYFLWLGGNNNDVTNNWILHDLTNFDKRDQIIFLPHKENTLLTFVGSDIFLMTSRADPFPCVIHEAMAAELPVVCYDKGGGFAEIVNETCGIVVPYGNLILINNALEILVHDKVLRENLGGNAKKMIETKFKYSDYCKDLIQLLPNSISKELELQFSINTTEEKNIPIIFTLPDWWISGVNTFIEDLITGLLDRGYNAYILFTRLTAYKNVDECNRPNVPFRFLELEIGNDLETIENLNSYLKFNSPCIFVPNYDYLSSSLSPQLDSNIGILGVLHSDDVEHYEHAYRLGHYWNKIISVTKTIENKLLSINSSFKPKSSVINYGINLSKISEPKKASNKNKLNIIYTGRMVQHQKRILDFIPIIEALFEKTNNFQFVFIGDGSDLFKLQNGLKKFIEDGLVLFLGKQPKEVIIEELLKAHVFALISDFEGLPLSIIEALACGCVPVTTDIESGISEILTHNENSLKSPIGETSKFVDNLLKLVENQNLYNKLQKNSTLTIGKYNLDHHTMTNRYISVIDQIIDEIRLCKFERNPIVHNSRVGPILLPQKYQQIN